MFNEHTRSIPTNSRGRSFTSADGDACQADDTVTASGLFLNLDIGRGLFIAPFGAIFTWQFIIAFA